MKKYLLPTLGFVLTILLVSLSGINSTAFQASNNISIENENIALEITGGQNVPKFSFWKPGDENTIYRVQFHNMFEIIDDNNNNQFDSDTEQTVPQSQQALASWNWIFTDVVENDDETTFNITGDGSFAPVMGTFDLIFVNHLGANASEFKFDVIVDNYEFVSGSDNAMLVLAFSLTTANNAETAEDQGNSIQFGDAFLDVEETATTDAGNINVGLTLPGNDSKIAYIAYEKFDGGFVHDPTLGIGESDGIPFSTIGILVGIIVLAIPVINKKRK